MILEQPLPQELRPLDLTPAYEL